MATRYCNTSEESEIVALYKSGEYSYRQIAEMKSLSKSTVINIVRGYPYNRDKQAYYDKLQTASAERLEQEITAVNERAQKAYSRGNIAAYGLHIRQWLTLLDMLPEKEKLYERMKDERRICEQRAWGAFGNSDYGEFGYCADTWKLLTYIIGDNARNPWGAVAKESNAKGKARSVKFARKALERQKINFTATTEKPEKFRLSAKSWGYLCPLVMKNNKTGRPSDHRRILEGILYALLNCNSFRKVPREYGGRFPLTAHFAQWYKEGVFTDLLAFAPVCPELKAAIPVLLQIEKHRLLYGDFVPRLGDLKA